MSSDKFCLRWNDYESNLSRAFKDLREEKNLFDVTLVCQDVEIPAHKVVLAACSPFFRDLLVRHPHPSPLLYLTGVASADLAAVLEFIYNGAVNIAQTVVQQCTRPM